MRLLSLHLFTCLCLMAPNLGSAAIYKHIAEDGTVFYSDKPMKADDKVLKETPVMSFPPVPRNDTQSETKGDGSPPDGGDGGLNQQPSVNYQTLVISSPSDGEVVRSNSGEVTIQMKLTPNLVTAAKHKLVVSMDGTSKQETSGVSATFSNVDRGSHSFSAQVLDANGQSLLVSPAVQVQVQRSSVVQRQKGN